MPNDGYTRAYKNYRAERRQAGRQAHPLTFDELIKYECDDKLKPAKPEFISLP